LGGNALALAEFISVVISTTDPLDVENALGKFMDNWGSPEAEYAADAANAIVGAVLGGGPADTIMNSITTGTKLTILAIGYSFRVAFYINLED